MGQIASKSRLYRYIGGMTDLVREGPHAESGPW